MPTFRKIFLLILTFISSQSCTKSISVDNILNRHDLETQIAKDIKVPFDKFDTLILDASPFFLCGTSPPKEILELNYKPKTDSVIYLQEIKSKIVKPIIITGIKNSDNEEDLMTTKEFVDLQTSWKEYDNYLKNKVILKIDGYLISNDTVSISETFHHFDSLITIEKVFVFNKGNWTSKIIKQNLLTRGNNYTWKNKN